MKIRSGLCSVFITAAVLLTAFAVGNMYPFGWETLSWCDMNQQLIPLFCDFKDILQGEKSLFLNFSNGGGMNFYGVFFFFLASPFSFAVAFTEKADIPFLMNILVILKLCTASFTAAYALTGIAKKLNFGAAAALGSSYALCGYAMLFYQNIMWLDIMYLFPLIVLGIYRLIEENRLALLCVTLTLAVVFNFYISFMIYLFVIFFFGIFALFYPNANRKIYVNLGLCGILSLVSSSIVWVPCLLQYTQSARGNSFLKELQNAGFFAPYETTLTVLLCSGLIFAGIIFILPKITLQKKEIKFLACVFLFTAIPIIIEPVNLMWHTGSYMSFPVRYGFIPVFIGLLITAEKLSERTDKKGKDLTFPTLIIVTVLSVFALLFTGKNTQTLSAYVNTLWGNNKSLKGELFLCALFTICYLCVLFFSKKGGLKTGVTAVLLCLVVFAEGLCSCEIFMLTAKDSLSLYNYQSVISLKEKAHKEGFYRLNTTHKITDANMTGAAGFNSISHYTSLNDQTFMETAKKLGYSGYWMETGNWGGSILSDALLSVGYTVTRTNGEYELSENPYYLGLGIKAQGEIPESLREKDRLLSLGNAFSKMSNTTNPVIKYDYKKALDCILTVNQKGYSITNTGEVGTISYSITVNEPQTLYFDCYNGFSTRLTEKINNSLAIYVNGQPVAENYPSQSFNGLLRLGNFSDTSVDITIRVIESVDCSSFGVFGVREDLLKSYTESAKTLQLKSDVGQINGKAEKGNYFISIPFRRDYKITLNGEKLSYTKALDGFIGVNIPEDGKLKITFTPKGFCMGLILSVVGIALFAILIVLGKRELFYKEKIRNITYGVFLGVWSIAVLWVYIIPTIVNLSDFMI